jgi:DNA-binding transcriptional ArsR family regulator
MNSQLREKAIKLRLEKELSYGEIKKRLGVSKSTLSYWLKEFPLNEEKLIELRRKGWKKGEVSRERFRATMMEKKKEKEKEAYALYRERFTNVSKDDFFIAGLTLYLGEGGKLNNTQVSLANTDPKVIRFFIKWMCLFFETKKEEIRVQLHLYENMDIKKEKTFWRKELSLQEKQIYKPSIRKLKKKSFSYKSSYRHGTCSVYILSTEKKRKVMMAIQAFMNTVEENYMGA